MYCRVFVLFFLLFQSVASHRLKVAGRANTSNIVAASKVATAASGSTLEAATALEAHLKQQESVAAADATNAAAENVKVAETALEASNVASGSALEAASAPVLRSAAAADETKAVAERKAVAEKAVGEKVTTAEKTATAHNSGAGSALEVAKAALQKRKSVAEKTTKPAHHGVDVEQGVLMPEDLAAMLRSREYMSPGCGGQIPDRAMALFNQYKDIFDVVSKVQNHNNFVDFYEKMKKGMINTNEVPTVKPELQGAAGEIWEKIYPLWSALQPLVKPGKEPEIYDAFFKAEFAHAFHVYQFTAGWLAVAKASG